MEEFFKEYAIFNEYNYNSLILAYECLDKNKLRRDDGVIMVFCNIVLDDLITLKIIMGRDLYKQDMLILCNMCSYINFANYNDFILYVDKILKENNILNMSLEIIDKFNYPDYYALMAYYIGTFLEDESFDIKIALK